MNKICHECGTTTSFKWHEVAVHISSIMDPDGFDGVVVVCDQCGVETIADNGMILLGRNEI